MACEQTEDIYAYTTVFKINSEKDVDDFWSYLIFRLNLERNEKNYDRFARLYNFLNDNKNFLSPLKSINISLRESSEKYFLFIETSIDVMINRFIKRLEALNFPYSYDKKVLSYAIEKRVPKETAGVKKSEAEKPGVYDFISPNDLEEMRYCIEKMHDGSYSKVYMEELSAYRETLSCYSGFLQQYPQLGSINSSVAELCIILSLYSEESAEMGIDFRRLLQSFVNNIWYWQESLFVKGGEDLHFMDDSFRADLSQIKMTLKLYDEVGEEEELALLEDIFDF